MVLRVTGLQVRGYVFSTYQSLPSIRGRANSVPTLNRLFARLTFSAVEAHSYPNFTKLTLTIALWWHS